jgi:hypothetical protein
MRWNLEDFLMLECVEPGLVIGQVDCICSECNCTYWSNWVEDAPHGYECPNCGTLNEPS